MAIRKAAPAAQPADAIGTFADKLRAAMEERWQFYDVPHTERDERRPGALRQIDAIEESLRAEADARRP
jgi:hypothetical protein